MIKKSIKKIKKVFLMKNCSKPLINIGFGRFGRFRIILG